MGVHFRDEDYLFLFVLAASFGRAAFVYVPGDSSPIFSLYLAYTTDDYDL